MVVFDAEFERELSEWGSSELVRFKLEENYNKIRMIQLDILRGKGVVTMELFVALFKAFYPDVSTRTLEYLYLGFTFYESDLKLLDYVVRNTTSDHVRYIKMNLLSKSNGKSNRRK